MKFRAEEIVIVVFEMHHDSFFFPVSIKDVDFSVDVVAKKLKDLKPNKAPGPDNIHSAVLREYCDVLSVTIDQLV